MGSRTCGAKCMVSSDRHGDVCHEFGDAHDRMLTMGRVMHACLTILNGLDEAHTMGVVISLSL